MDQLALLQEEDQEFDDMDSFNHSTVQGNLAYVLKRIGKYTAPVEPSLDSSSLDKGIYKVADELIPNVCIYPKRDLVRADDIIRMKDMPLMVVEVLSFRQFTSSLVEKFRAYFALGVQSCWLVDPVTQTVHVYSAHDQWRSFSIEDELVDEVLNIRLAVADIFES